MKNRHGIITTILLALGVFALSPIAQAVSPPPDGGYPGQNTAEGQSALLHLSGGTYNTAVGWSSLGFNTTGNLNTAVGAGSLLFNTGFGNTATGAGALLNNTSSDNTANGAFALFSNIAGSQNTATGSGALQNNTDGYANTASGLAALQNNTTGYNNVAIGGSALYFNTTGTQNTAIGTSALAESISGSNNIALGAGTGINVTSANNVICIGFNVSGNNVDNSCYIGNIFGATSSNGVGVFVNSNGRLGTMTSSRRFKERIKPMGNASEALLALKPVTFRYKSEIDPAGTPQFGLVAEEVEKLNPNLVVRDKEGKPYSVRYEQINAMLLNEFLKEHKRIEEQQVTIAQLQSTAAQQQKRIEVLATQLEEQAAQIQNVTAKSRSASSLVIGRNESAVADRIRKSLSIQ